MLQRNHSLIGALLFLLFVSGACRSTPPEKDGIDGVEGAPLVFTDKLLEEEVEGKSDGVALILMYRQNCGACQAFLPTLKRLAGRYEKKAIIGQIDVTEFPALKKKYGINTVPFIAFFKDGRCVEKLQGKKSEREVGRLEKKLDGYLKG